MTEMNSYRVATRVEAKHHHCSPNRASPHLDFMSNLADVAVVLIHKAQN